VRRASDPPREITGHTQQQAMPDSWLAQAVIQAASNSGIKP
jgi:hypothetical protein